jgi:hypothetical protein
MSVQGLPGFPASLFFPTSRLLIFLASFLFMAVPHNSNPTRRRMKKMNGRRVEGWKDGRMEVEKMRR